MKRLYGGQVVQDFSSLIHKRFIPVLMTIMLSVIIEPSMQSELELGHDCSLHLSDTAELLDHKLRDLCCHAPANLEPSPASAVRMHNSSANTTLWLLNLDSHSALSRGSPTDNVSNDTQRLLSLTSSFIRLGLF